MGSNTSEMFIANQRQALGDARARLETVLRQLEDTDVNWRPNDQSNSIANLVMHVCGYFDRRHAVVLAGRPAAGNKDAEFGIDLLATRDELLHKVAASFKDADSILEQFDLSRMAEPVEIRGRTTTILGLITKGNLHLAEHLGQILYIAKIRMGSRYKAH